MFFTLKISSVLKLQTSGEFYFWNSHCYAFRDDRQLVEDIDAARASYFQRDARLMLLMAASVILLPVVTLIAAKKLLRAGSRAQMQTFLGHETHA